MSARTEFVLLNKMKEKGKLSFEDIKRIIDRSVNKTNEFINVLKKYYSFNLETVDNLEE
mgnify:FL=1